MTRTQRFLARLADLQSRRAGTFLLGALGVCALSLVFIRDLGLDSRFVALLPEDRPSVQDLEAARQRMRGVSTLAIGIQSPSKNVEGMRRFARELAERLAARPADEIGYVDWNVRDYADFVEANYQQYAPLELLERLYDAMDMRLQDEQARHNPLLVRLEDDSEAESLEDVLDDLEARREEGKGRSARYPEGYFQHPDGDLVVVFVRSNASEIAGGASEVTRRVAAEIEAMNPASYGSDITVTLTGEVIIAKEEQKAIAQELVAATALTSVAVVAVLLLFYRRFRAVPLLGLGFLPGGLVTFAYAELTVGALNTSTAFLASVIIGNGINPHIVWLSRYFEERKAGKSVRDAIEATHQNAWVATFVAIAAASAAYGSLMVTEFRGFFDFGVIGSAGMLFCWASAMLVLPALSAMSERIRPLRFDETAAESHGGPVADLLARLVTRAPRAVVGVALVISAVTAASIYVAVMRDPFEYDFRKLRSVRESADATVREVNHRINAIVPKTDTGGGIAMLLPTVDAIPMVEAQLEPTRGSAHGDLRTIHDLLPRDAEAKRELLLDIRDLALQLRRYADDETKARIDEHLPPEEIPVLGPGDLPERVARPFTEADGTRGTIVYVEQNEEESSWDGRYLIRWAESLRAVRLADGTRPPLVGRATIFADMIDAVYNDMPLAIAAALSVTAFLCLVSFRRWRDRLQTLGALLLGVVWMAGTMALFGMKLNFLNFVCFPVTFGTGVDYSINIMQRVRLQQELGDPDAIASSVTRTGGAVILCSLTAVIGYSSLFVSANQAMRSFGLAMTISELTCLAVAILPLPALLTLIERRRRR